MTDSAAARLRSLPNRGLWLTVGALLVLVVSLGLFYVMSRGVADPAPSRSDVASFSGEGNQVTDSFTVGGSWQIHWASEGDAFSFAIRGDRDYGVVIDEQGPGSGVTSPVGSGTFHLEVTADGPWSIEIFEDG